MLVFFRSAGQETEKKFFVKGYVKDLQGAFFKDDADEITAINFLHNRINLSWYPTPFIKFRLEPRTRLFFGNQAGVVPFLPDDSEINDGLIDLTWLLADHRSMVVHTTIDRAAVSFSKNKWEFTAGRQRINWGITTVWNPNDIFNTSNYFDFDYAERPGTDALRVRYRTGEMSELDAAYSPSDESKKSVTALLYRFNYKNYDLQFLGGKWKNEWVTGGGWAGNIRNWGFKGEATYFIPKEKKHGKSISASVVMDRSLKNELYVSSGFLFNSSAGNQSLMFSLLPGTELSARSLMPFRYSFLLQGEYSFNHVFFVNFSLIYSTADNSVIIFPNIVYSVSEKFEADFTMQSFFSESDNKYAPQGNFLFLRFRYDF